jgi:hypothetical protein
MVCRNSMDRGIAEVLSSSDHPHSPDERLPGVEVERKWQRADYQQPGQHLVKIQTR